MNWTQGYDRDEFTDYLLDFLPGDFTPACDERCFDSKVFNCVTYLGESERLNTSVYEIEGCGAGDARAGAVREAFRLMKKS